MKIFFAVAAVLVTIVGYWPYFRDLFAKKTRPHIYTWLIWLITQGTAVAALIYGGGGFGGAGLAVSLVFMFTIFLLSFKYGTKNITKTDTALLILALSAIIVWWQLDSPLWSVIMVASIDGLAYIPTFRKTCAEPYSETLSYWIIMVASDILGILALTEYNILTMTYLSTLVVANTIVFIMIVGRRKIIPSHQLPDSA